MKLYIKNHKDLPENTLKQAYPSDACLDIIATSEPRIIGEDFSHNGERFFKSIKYIEYSTSIYCAPESEYGKHADGKDYHLELYSRSSISTKNLVLANSVGISDNGYRNELLFRFKYIMQAEDIRILENLGVFSIINNEKIYQKFDKIGQIKPSPNIPIEIVYVDNLPDSVRGEKGFGSSGR